MSNLLLAVILLTNVALFATVAIAFFKFFKVYTQTKDLLASFFTPASEGEATPFAQLVANSGDILAGAIVARLKAQIMAGKSGEVRGENAVEGELAVDLASQANPIVGALIQQFPGLRRLAKKNPALVDAVVTKFINNKFGGGGQPSPGTNHQTPPQVKMTL